MVKIEKRLTNLGLTLPRVSMDTKYWSRCKRAGNLLFIGTTGPWPIINKSVKGKWTGVIGREVTLEEGKLIARMSALSILAVIRNELGDLDKIEKFLKIDVHMHFEGQEVAPYIEVADAASELFIQVLGDSGRASRTIFSSVDRSSVQIDAVVHVKD
jgi:hypothetical protein